MFNFSLDHIIRMTDDRGILEHCLFATPDMTEGYTTDDNARALQVALRLDSAEKRKRGLINTYLKFLLSARTKKGFHNDLNSDLTWEDKGGTGEWFGRAMEAFGETQKLTGIFVFDQASFLVRDDCSLRAKAHLIVGLANRLKFEKTFSKLSSFLEGQKRMAKEKGGFSHPPINFRLEITRLADELVEAYQSHSEKSWQWYEDIITYDNGRLPFGLFWAYQTVGKKLYRKVAEESLNFLMEKTYDVKKDCFSFPGYRGWFPKGGKMALFGQQPIEAGATVEACICAYKVTGKKSYFNLALKAFEWYTGRNVLGISLLDSESGGVRDGLEPWGVNPNEGAESILSYILACLALQGIE